MTGRTISIAGAVAAAICLLLIAASADAASFNCAKAKHPVEKAICANKELSALDEELAQLYKELHGMMKGDPQSLDVLKNEQKTWVEMTRSEKADAASLITMYKNRVEVFRLMLILENMRGYFLAEQYAELLKKTRAPQKTTDALKDTAIFYITMFREKARYWLSVSSFHEGGRFIVADLVPHAEKGSYTLTLRQEDQEQGQPEYTQQSISIFITVEADSADAVKAMTFPSPGEKKKTRYIKLPVPLNEFLNGTVLAGTYTDTTGKTFTFSEAGVAVWPDKSFEYTIVPDSTESDCEYFSYIIRSTPIAEGRYGYAWKDEKLYIYDIIDGATVGGAPISCSEKPILVLTPQKK